MKVVSATEARKDIYNLVELTGLNHEPIQIISKRGSAILIAESDWAVIQEMLHIISIPGMADSIKKGLKTPLKNCSKNLKW
jgi:antitoxin YefM